MNTKPSARAGTRPQRHHGTALVWSVLATMAVALLAAFVLVLNQAVERGREAREPRNASAAEHVAAEHVAAAAPAAR